MEVCPAPLGHMHQALRVPTPDMPQSSSQAPTINTAAQPIPVAPTEIVDLLIAKQRRSRAKNTRSRLKEKACRQQEREAFTWVRQDPT